MLRKAIFIVWVIGFIAASYYFYKSQLTLYSVITALAGLLSAVPLYPKKQHQGNPNIVAKDQANVINNTGNNVEINNKNKVSKDK